MEIEAETPLNEKIVALCQTGAGAEILVSRPTGTEAPQSGRAGPLLDPARLSLFDAASGARTGLSDLRHLLPPVPDGATTAHRLADAAARATGLRAGLPAVLGYLDVICTSFGGGLMAAEGQPGLTVIGSTGMHMIRHESANAIRFTDSASGYVMAFPGGGWAQMQTDMAATLNIDWLLDAGPELLASQGLVRDRAALYHPYISTVGQRGPFVEPDARASFTGLSQDVGWFGLTRSVAEGLGLAARDYYAATGETPSEIRLSGGGARSPAILAATLERPVRVAAREEAGAAIIAAFTLGLYDSAPACVADWVTPWLGEAETPDPELARTSAPMFRVFVETRDALAPVWPRLQEVRRAR